MCHHEKREGFCKDCEDDYLQKLDEYVVAAARCPIEAWKMYPKRCVGETVEKTIMGVETDLTYGGPVLRKLYSELKGKKIFADGSFVAPSTYHKDRWVACEKDGMPVTDCGDIAYKDSPEEAIELLKSKGLGKEGGK